ncbi:thioredoxin domain-containing protein [Paludisphaera sp.]|uniref:thioredoxin domain-containing protein n=1 Tax=Paludisphaera sp. TaxID=2017432 RepID=UPI00301C8787
MKLAPVLLLLAGAAQAAAGEPQPVLLDFNAEWCGPCRQMRPAVKALIDKDYPVKSVDIDRSPDLAEKYNVQAVPTFVVVDASGAELARTSGAQPAGKLARFYLQARDQAAARQADRGAEEGDEEPEAEAEEPPDARLVDAEPDQAADDGLTESEIAERNARNRAVNPKPWETAVRIRVHNGSSIGFGSGTVIHSTDEQSLILTCAHIFKADNGRNYPPSKFPNKITVDLFDGKLKGRNGDQLSCVEEGIPGKAVDYDFATDVGLIVIRPGRRLPASRVVPPHFDPKKRMHMYTVGCSEGADATMWETVITRPPTRLLKGNDEHLAIECVRAPKQGRSGGGLYTDNGFVAGVCNFAEPQGNRGLYAAPESIYRLLDRNKLAALYAPPSLDGSGTLMADNSRPGRSIRGQSPEPDSRRQPSARGGGLSVPEPSIVGIRLEPLEPSDPRRPQVQAASSRAGGDRVAWAAPRSARPAEGIPHLAAQQTDLDLDRDDSPFPPQDFDEDEEGDDVPTGAVNEEDVAPATRKPAAAPSGGSPGWRPVGNPR